MTPDPLRGHSRIGLHSTAAAQRTYSPAASEPSSPKPRALPGTTFSQGGQGRFDTRRSRAALRSLSAVTS